MLSIEEGGELFELKIAQVASIDYEAIKCARYHNGLFFKNIIIITTTLFSTALFLQCSLSALAEHVRSANSISVANAICHHFIIYLKNIFFKLIPTSLQLFSPQFLQVIVAIIQLTLPTLYQHHFNLPLQFDN